MVILADGLFQPPCPRGQPLSNGCDEHIFSHLRKYSVKIPHDVNTNLSFPPRLETFLTQKSAKDLERLDCSCYQVRRQQTINVLAFKALNSFFLIARQN